LYFQEDRVLVHIAASNGLVCVTPDPRGPQIEWTTRGCNSNTSAQPRSPLLNLACTVSDLSPGFISVTVNIWSLWWN